MANDSFESHYEKIEDLLSKSLRYEVPPNQRDFAWEKNDQIADFWSDLKESMVRNEDHFFGTIFLVKTEDEDQFEILDGQQRLATSTILLAVIRDKLYELGDLERSKIIQQSIAILTDEKTLEPIERLKLNLKNRTYFLDYIQRDITDGKRKKFNGKKLETTNKLINDAYNYFNEEIGNALNSIDDRDKKKEYLTNISSHLKRRIKVIRTVVSTHAIAYRLFMTINFRGMELSVADLFKNHIIGESPRERKSEVIGIWSEIASLLDEAGIVNFLRHYWASKIGNVGEDDLYDSFTNYLKKERKDVVTFAKELKDEAEIYGALFNPKSEFWTNKYKKISELLEDIKTLNIRQCFPLLLSGRIKLSDRDFRKLLDICINFTFRYITICGLNNKQLEGLYSDIAISLRNGKITKIDEIKKELKKEYVNDEKFLILFNQKEIKINKVARYILQKIEDSLSGGREPQYKDFTLEHTLEHILPENPDQEWKEFLKSKGLDKDELVNRIGNLTLLPKRVNKDEQNRFFTMKREEYKRYKLKINENFKNINEWTDKEIDERQRWLGKKAINIWKL